MIKSLKDLLDKFSRFTNSLVYDGEICKRLKCINKRVKMEPTVNKIGKIIKKRRKELNLELKDLQDYSGINYASISDIENGKANPTIKTLEKLLDVLGLQINIEVVSK